MLFAIYYLRSAFWLFLPVFATRILLFLYYKCLNTQGKDPPRRGSSRWQLHYQAVLVTVVLVHLSYNIVEMTRDASPNLFQVLGTYPDVDDAGLRSAFRSLAKRYHPDRAGSASGPMFITLRNTYESLKDPLKRFAYERFGPDALTWGDCFTPENCLEMGMQLSFEFYVKSIIPLVAVSLVARNSFVFWRFMLLLSLFVSEQCLTSNPRSSGLLGLLFPDRAAFQHIHFLRHLFLSLFAAFTRIGPVLFADDAVVHSKNPKSSESWLRKLRMLGSRMSDEGFRLLHLVLHATNKSGEGSMDSIPRWDPSPGVLEKFLRKMEDILVRQYVRAKLPLRLSWDRAVQRKLEHEREREQEEEWEMAWVENSILSSPEGDWEAEVEGMRELAWEKRSREDRAREKYSRLPSPSLSPKMPPNPLLTPKNVFAKRGQKHKIYAPHDTMYKNALAASIPAWAMD